MIVPVRAGFPVEVGGGGRGIKKSGQLPELCVRARAPELAESAAGCVCERARPEGQREAAKGNFPLLPPSRGSAPPGRRSVTSVGRCGEARSGSAPLWADRPPPPPGP